MLSLNLILQKRNVIFSNKILLLIVPQTDAFKCIVIDQYCCPCFTCTTHPGHLNKPIMRSLYESHKTATITPNKYWSKLNVSYKVRPKLGELYSKLVQSSKLNRYEVPSVISGRARKLASIHGDLRTFTETYEHTKIRDRMTYVCVCFMIKNRGGQLFFDHVVYSHRYYKTRTIVMVVHKYMPAVHIYVPQEIQACRFIAINSM